jgi:hypothetical protein
MGSNHNVGAGFGIGFGVVMLQWNIEGSANVGELSRANVPNLACQLNRALKRPHRWCNLGRLAAGKQHVAIEAGIVGCNEIDTLELLIHLGPQLRKGRLILNIRPGQPMNVGKFKLTTGRANQPVMRTQNLVMIASDNGDRTGTIGPSIRRLKVNRRKITRPASHPTSPAPLFEEPLNFAPLPFQAKIITLFLIKLANKWISLPWAGPLL